MDLNKYEVIELVESGNPLLQTLYIETNAKTHSPKDILGILCLFGDANMVETFLCKFHDIDRSVLSESLKYAVQSSKAGVLKVLLDHGADISTIDTNGVSLLHLAIYVGELDIIKFLVENNIDVNILDRKKQTPLRIAKALNEEYVMSYLQEQGGKV